MPHRITRRLIPAVLCLWLQPAMVHAEGTKQLRPVSSLHGQLCIDKSRNDFALYDGAMDYRLNIAIADPSETIRFGFGTVTGDYLYPTELAFRIKDPSGNIAYNQSVVPASGAGYIGTYAQAFAGPFPAAGGYTHEDKHMLQYFDITVINSTGDAVNGRVWSKGWQLWSENPDEADSRFYGKMMILSNDSIATQLDCNGFRGGTFSVSSNMTGCANTGNLSYDRKSREGFYTYPQHKVFLNDPDSILFPTAKISSGIVGIPAFTPDCTTGGGVIGITAKKEGTVKILVEINPSPGADPEDAEIVASVKTGDNSIPWDGNDSYSLPVPNGTALTVFGHNNDCGDGPVSSLFITTAAEPDVDLAEFPDVCYTAPAFLLEGGQPAGGKYLVDGSQADSLFPYKETEGLHTIVYTYTAPTGCSNSDTTETMLLSGPDCEGFLMFPNAFTPNNDNSNDVFKPAVMQNIYRVRMEIYNRWGEFIYSTEDITRGWDGTFNGQACPGGVYLYTVTFGVSLRTNENEKMRGIMTLLR